MVVEGTSPLTTDVAHGGPIHFAPAPWPAEPVDPANCGVDCGDWKPYTRFQTGVNDPRVQDPSNGGTSPQNYVNIASSCIDKNLPSIYYNLRKGAAADGSEDVIMFRWRVEQIANTYATGPNAGSFGATDPWNSALWTVLFDLDGDGFRDLAAHLDGSSGAPATSIDRLAGIWGNIPTQSVDYLNDPSINLIAHNPTAFIGPNDKVLNFAGDPENPTESWPNGSSESVWDYGTSRSRLITTKSCTEYFIDYQIPVRMLDASSSGPNPSLNGPRVDRSTPISMLFCTANSLNNPFQKDCALNAGYIGNASKPAPFGDYLSFDKDTPYAQPIVTSVTASPPSTCPGSYGLTAKIQDTLFVNASGSVEPSIKSVVFYYWYDLDGDGTTAGDPGSAWTYAAPGALQPGSLNTWTASWDANSLPRGRYLIGVQALDDRTKHDLGVPHAPIDHRTFSYLPGSSAPATQAQIYTNDWSWDGLAKIWVQGTEIGWIDGQEALFPAHVDPTVPGPSEDWYGNPDVTGVQTALIGVALNVCGVAPELQKSANVVETTAGGDVRYTLSVVNKTGADIKLSSITDTLPEGFTYVSTQGLGDTPASSLCTGSCPEPSTAGGNSYTWTFAANPSDPAAVTIPGGCSAPNYAACTRNLVYNTKASATVGTYNNTATMVTDFGTVTSNPAQVGVGAPRLTISKTPTDGASPPNPKYSALPSESITYVITYSNDSPVSATNVVLTDVIPAGLDYVSCSDGCTLDGNTLTWTIGDLVPGEGPYSVSFTATLASPYPDTASVPNINTATIDGDNTDPADATASVFVQVPRPQLVIQKTADKLLVDPAGTSPANQVTFTLSYANTGDAATTDAVLSDPLPAGFTFVSCSETCDNPGVGNNGTVSWNLGPLNARESGSVTLTAQASNPFTGTENPVTNTASLSSAEVTTPVTDSADVGISQSGQLCRKLYLSDDQADVGSDGTQYLATTSTPTGPFTTISKLADDAANSGIIEIARFYQDPVSSQLVTFDGSSTLGGQLDYIKSNSLGGSATANSVLYVTVYDYDPDTGETTPIAQSVKTDNGSPSPPVSLTGVTPSGSLAKGHRLLIVMGVDMTANRITTIELHANSATSYVEICSPPPANLVLNKTVDAVSIDATGASRTLTYTLNYANTSGSTGATGAILTDTLPLSGVTYSSCSFGSSHFTGCSHAGGVVSFHDGLNGGVSIPAGASGSVTVTVNVADSLSVSSLLNTASIISDQTSAVEATAITTVVGGEDPDGTANLVINKAASETLLQPGESVTYTLTALNAGTKTATAIQITDDFPEAAWFTYKAGSCMVSVGTCTPSGTPSSSLSWAIDSLAPGETATLSFTLEVGDSSTTSPPDGVTTRDNLATGDYGGCETAPCDATSNTVTVSVTTNPYLAIEKGVSPSGIVAPGETLTYTLLVNNTGSGAANNLIVRDPIPANTSFIAGSTTQTLGSASFDAVNNQVIFNLGTLAAGGSATLSFQVKLNSPLPAGDSTLTNLATVTASNAPSRTDDAITTAQAAPLLTLDKSGPASAPYPAASLTAAATNSTTLFVNSTATFEIGQIIQVGATLTRITGIAGSTVTVDTAVTAAANTDVIGAVTYSLTYRNTGNAEATGVVITDTLPAGPPGLTYFASSPNASSAPTIGASGDVEWNLGTLAAGASGAVQVTAMPTGAGTVTNLATIDSAQTAPVEDSIQTAFGGLRITKRTTTPITTAPGEATYVIEVTNSLDSPVAGVTLTDSLASGFAYASTGSIVAPDATRTSEDNPTVGTQQPTWGTWTLPANGSLTLTFTSTVTDAVGPGTYQNEAAVATTTPGVGITPFDPLSTTAEDVTVLPPDTGLVEGIIYQDNDKDGQFDPAVDTPLGGVAVTIIASDGTVYVAITDSSGFYSQVVPEGATVIDVQNGTVPSDLVLTTSTGDDGTDPVTVMVPSGDTASKNTGYVPADEGLASIIGNVWNDADDNQVVNGSEAGMIGVQVILRDTNGEVVATEYTDALGNYAFPNIPPGHYQVDVVPPQGYLVTTGNDPAPVSVREGETGTANFGLLQGVILSGTVFNDIDGNGVQDGGELGLNPGGLNLVVVDASGTVLAVAPVANDGTWSAEVNTGSDYQAYYTLQNPTVGATVTPLAQLPAGWLVTGENIDGLVQSPANGILTGIDASVDQSGLNFGIGRIADLIVQKNGPVLVDPAGTITYTVTVSNAGPAAADGAVFADANPSDLTDMTWTCGNAVGGAVCPNASGEEDISETIAIFPAGGSLTYTITGTAPATGTVTNTATVTAPAGVSDPDLSNNSDQVETGLGATPATADLSVLKFGLAQVAAGETLTYRIIVSNAGYAAANNAVFTDTVPVGVTDVTWTCEAVGGAICPDDVTREGSSIEEIIATFPAGASLIYTVTGTVTANINDIIENTAIIDAPDGVTDPDLSNNASSVETIVVGPDVLTSSADLALVKTGPATVAGGGEVTYELVVSNAGADAADDALVSDLVPSVLSEVAWTCGNATGGAVCPTLNTNLAEGELNSGKGDVNLIIPTFPAGSSVTITVTGTAPAAGAFVNSAQVIPPDGVLDPDPSNNPGGPVITQIATVILAGVVFNDNGADGGTAANGLQDGGEPGLDPGSLNVVVLDGDDKVLAVVAVDDTGAWSAPVPAGSGYSVYVTTASPTLGETIDSPEALLPSGWTITGETADGSTSDVKADGILTEVSATTSIDTLDFGIRELVSALTLAKSISSGSPYAAVGDVISYSYLVTNSGNVLLDGPVTVADDKATVTCPAVDTIGNLDDALDPGEALTCTASYTVSQADLNAGSVTNTATASADGTDSAPDTATAQATQGPALTLVKSISSGSPYAAVGDVISYSYLVTNSGNVLLDGPVTVADDKATVTCPAVDSIGNLDDALDPGEALTCTASYTVSQADLNAGSVTNIATASADGTDSAPDTATAQATQGPALTLVKSISSGSPYAAVGDVISYSYLVTNSGNVLLDGPVTVADDKATVTCPAVDTIGNLDDALDPGEALTCTASYTVSQADLNAGSVTNTATASADGTDSAPDTATAQATQTPALTLVKTADPQSYAAVGDQITYTFEVTNSGNVTLFEPFAVDDDRIALVDCSVAPATLPPGASFTCTATYSITADDLSEGSVTNEASATGTDPNGDEVTSPTDTETVLVEAADVGILKSANPASANPGDVVTFTLTLSNAGPADATGVSLLDTLPNGYESPEAISDGGVYDATAGTVSWSGLSIASGATLELSYTARARAPGDGVSFVNTVTVTGSDQYDPNPNNDTATATVAPLVADLAITKTQIAAPPAPEPGVVLTVDDMVEITPSTITAGNQIHYLLTITNAGPDNAINATVTDALPAGLSNVEFSRNFGNSWNAWSGALSYASFTAGSTDFIVIRGTVAADQTQDVINTASVDSDTHDPVSTNNQDTLTTPVTQSADLALTKEELDAPIEAGGAIDYRITVENLGPSDASGVVITDALSNDVSDAEYSLNGTDWSDWLGSYTVGDLARGETFQLLIRGTVVAAPSGTAITNTASVSATTQDPNPDNDAETIETPLDEFVDLSIVKTGSPATVTAGEQILYTLTVTNHNAPGGFAARTVRISDVFDPAVFTGIEYSTTGVDGPWSPWVSPLALGELAAGEARTIVLRATVKSTVTAIAVTNTATVTTDTPDLDPTNNTSTEETPIERRADLKMEKRLLTAPENVVAGGQVQYELVYTNLGPSDASNVVVTDAVPAAIVNPEAAFCATTSYQPWTGSANVGTVVAGGECRIFIRGTLAADYKGSLTNTASVASDITDPISENNEDSREITVLNPSIALSKVGTLNDDDGTTGVSAGDTISYVFTVTNTGNATLTNITLVDAVAGVSISGGPIATLAPDAVDDTTFTGTYTLTQADIDAGSFTNTATVKGQYPGIPDVTDSDEDTQTLERTPALTLEKELTTAPEPIELGSELTYTVTATNTGNVTLTDVVVSDSLITPASETCASVAPTQTCVLSGTYTVTQADMDVGQVVNTATADSDQTDAVTDAVTTLIDTTPALTVEKVLTSADPNPIVLGSVLTYTVTATNDGDVTLTDVVVSDPLLTSDSEKTCASVAPDETCVLTGTYTVLQADVDAGQVVNTATADSDQTDAVTDEVTTLIDTTPALSVAKVLSGADPNPIVLGSVLTYTVTATNDGDVTLTDVVVSDPLLTSDSEKTCASVAPGETCVLTGTYTVLQADVDAGQVVNTATADSDQTDEVTDEETTPIATTPALSVAKVLSGADPNPIVLGSVLTYTVTATNDGDVTLTDVVVSDPLLTSDSEKTCASVAPGETCVLTGTYTVTQTDMDAGQVVNTATADSTETPEASDAVTTPISAEAALTLVKSADPQTYVAVGDQITYTFEVTNSGTLTLFAPFTVSDDRIDTVDCSAAPATLPPGASFACTATYSITADDLTTGFVTNVASATGTDPNGDEVTSPTDTETVQVEAADVGILKSANPASANPGDVVTFTLTLRNAGPADATGVSLLDTLPNGYDAPESIGDGSVYDGTAGTIAWSGLSIASGATLELSYTARARAPGDGVTFVNTVTVTGSDQYDPNPDNDTATATVAPLVADLAITKTQVEAPATLGQDPGTLVAVDPSAIGAGETIYYLLKIENLGPDAALDVTVSDALPDGISNAERSFNVGNSWGPWTGSHPLTSLAAGATTYILIRGQVDAAQSEALVNVATVASAVTTDPNPANNEDTLSTPVGASADLELEKAELVAPLEIGGPIEYRLTVTNRGPAVASGVVIEDELDALIIDAEYSMDGGVTYVTPWSGSYAVGELAVGATFVLRIRGTLVDDRTNPEVIDNTATVTADTEDPNPDNNSDTTNTPIDVDADVRIEKSGPANVIAGEQILYSITVTNDGPAAALNVRINDSVASSVFDAVEVSDDGGASWSPWTGQYVVGDLDAGASRTIALRATVRANVAVGTVLTNTAVAVSDTPDTQPNNNTDSAQTTVDGSADVGVVKTLQSAPEAAVAGTQVEFLITYFNRGPSDATNFIVEDAVPAGLTDVEASFCNQAFVPWTTPRNVGTVVAGGECRIVIRGTLAAGVEGELTNTAVVSSDLSDPDTSNNEDSASVTVLTPALSLTKTATAINGGTPDPFVYTGVGDTISYTFEVTNTGNAPLSGVVVYDDTFGVEVGTAATLAVGETESFTYVHPVTAADLDAGSLVNTATARGTYGETEYDATDTATVAGEQAGALTLEKTATLVNGEAAEPGEALVFAAVGDEISYQYTLTNTGNVTLTALAVADDRTTVSCPAEPLAAGAEITCTATDVVTQEDLDAGAVTNVATASGVDPNAGAVTSEPATVTVEAAQGPELTLEKVLSDAPEPIALDSVLTYTVTATNTGNVTLTNVVVSDSLITPASETCASVAVGETCVLTGTYRVTQTDVDAGQVVNTAIADSDETVEIEDILKTELPSPEPPSAVNDQSLGNPIGSVVTLQVLDNDSAYPGLNLVPATVVLDGADAGSDGKTQTVPGEGVWTVDPVTGAITFTPESGFTGNPTPISYLVQDDQGNLSNAATVTVTYEIAVNIVRRCDNNTPYVDYAIESAAVGALDIQWYAVLASGERGAPIGDPLLDQPREGRLLWPGAEVDTTTGEVVTWPGWELIDGQWERTNPHAQDVNEIEFSINPTISVRVQYPDPEPSCRPYPPIPVAEDDVSLGHASGTLVVVDVLSNDLPVDSHPLVPATVSIEDADAGSDGLVKTVPGEGVWRVDVTTGAISFEPEPGFLGNPTPIQYRVEDDRGETSNLASVTVTYQEAAALRLEKVLLSASPDPIQVGSTLSYQITATNSGNVTLTGVEVGDPLLTPSSTTCASLLPGESCVLTGTAVVSLADVLAGEVVNQATAASAQTAPIMDELITPVPMPAVPLAADDASLGHPLGTVVTLDVLANDSANAGLALDPATVWIEGTAAPGQSLVVAGEGTWSLNPTTGAITFTPAPGFEGNPTPIGYSVQDTASQTSNVATVTVSYLGAPALSLAKTLYLGHDDGAGCASSEGSLALVSNEQIDQPLTWCFRVTNTGEHYLDRPVLVDAPLGIDMSDLTLLEGQLPLAPGASATWYYEELRNVSLINDATVTMTPTDAAGVPSGVPLVGGSDAGVIFGYLYDPPYGVKTGEMLEGQPVVNWNMVWVNDSPLPALGVVINDPIPEGMTYLGNLVCLPNGDTTVSECRYEAPTLEAPRGRVYVVADFAPDFGAVVGGPVEQAPRHELTISFDVTIDEPTVEQVFENQGVAEWDPDGDGPAVALSGATSDGLSGEDRPTVIVVPALDPALTLDKALIGAPSVIGVGQVLTYRLTATNTGGEVLSNVTITDDLPGLSSLSCVPAQPATLTPGATLICEASYVVTVADVLAGQVDNRATVSGSMPSGAEIVATADLTVAVGGKPTPTPSVTPTPAPTPTPVPTPAATPTPVPTPAVTPTPVPTPAVTPTPTPTPSPIPSTKPTPTPAPTPEPTTTPVPTPSSTPVPTPAVTPKPTPTPAVTPTPAPTPTGTPTPTPTPAVTPTPAPTPTGTPTPTPTPAVTPTPVPTPAVTPTPAPTPSGSPTPTPSPIPTTASSALGLLALLLMVLGGGILRWRRP